MNLEQYIETLKQLDTYKRDSFTVSIEIHVHKAFLLNCEFKEISEKEEYIKRHLITHYFPNCLHMKVLDHFISQETEENGMTPLYCAIRVQTDEYKESVIKCLQHFLISPEWNVCHLSSINKHWHE